MFLFKLVLLLPLLLAIVSAHKHVPTCMSILLLLWGWLYWFCVCIMQHPGSFKTMGSTAVVCEENIIRKTEKKERKKREIL